MGSRVGGGNSIPGDSVAFYDYYLTPLSSGATTWPATDLPKSQEQLINY